MLSLVVAARGAAASKENVFDDVFLSSVVWRPSVVAFSHFGQAPRTRPSRTSKRRCQPATTKKWQQQEERMVFRINSVPVRLLATLSAMTVLVLRQVVAQDAPAPSATPAAGKLWPFNFLGRACRTRGRTRRLVSSDNLRSSFVRVQCVVDASFPHHVYEILSRSITKRGHYRRDRFLWHL